VTHVGTFERTLQSQGDAPEIRWPHPGPYGACVTGAANHVCGLGRPLPTLVVWLIASPAAAACWAAVSMIASSGMSIKAPVRAARFTLTGFRTARLVSPPWEGRCP
jgi:hypothetical protein